MLRRQESREKTQIRAITSDNPVHPSQLPSVLSGGDETCDTLPRPGALLRSDMLKIFPARHPYQISRKQIVAGTKVELNRFREKYCKKAAHAEIIDCQTYNTSCFRVPYICAFLIKLKVYKRKSICARGVLTKLKLSKADQLRFFSHDYDWLT